MGYGAEGPNSWQDYMSSDANGLCHYMWLDVKPLLADTLCMVCPPCQSFETPFVGKPRQLHQHSTLSLLWVTFARTGPGQAACNGQAPIIITRAFRGGGGCQDRQRN